MRSESGRARQLVGPGRRVNAVMRKRDVRLHRQRACKQSRRSHGKSSSPHLLNSTYPSLAYWGRAGRGYSLLGAIAATRARSPGRTDLGSNFRTLAAILVRASATDIGGAASFLREGGTNRTGLMRATTTARR